MQEAKGVEPRRFSLGKFFIFLIIVASILGVALFSFFDINPMILIKDGFSGLYSRMLQSVSQTNQRIKEIIVNDPTKPLSYGVLKDHLVICSDSDVRLYDSEGNEKWYVPLSLKKPFIQVDKQDILVADLEGKYFGIIRDGKVLWEKNLDQEIVNTSFSESWVLVITKSLETGYKRTIHAYSREGQEISFRSVADYYPFAVFNYPQYDKAGFVVCGVETQGLETSSLFEFLDLSMNQKGSMRSEKEIYSGALPLDKGRLLLFGEKSLICVDTALNTVWKIALNDDYLTCANTLKNQLSVAAILDGEVLNREKRHLTHVKVINQAGGIQFQKEVDAVVTDIATFGKTIAFAAGQEVYFMNDKGEVIDLYTSRTEVEQVYLAKDNLAYVITGGSVVRIQIQTKDKILGIF